MNSNFIKICRRQGCKHWAIGDLFSFSHVIPKIAYYPWIAHALQNTAKNI